MIGSATTRTLAAAAGLLALAATAIACSRPPVNRVADAPLQTVESVDLDRYLGRWYEIARLPNSFERGCEGVTAEYTRRDDGLIRVTNTCRRGAPDGPEKVSTGRARVVDTETNARLKVSFFGPFWGDYWIIGLAEDYSLALVGEPAGRYLWILARTPSVEPAVLDAALSDLTAMGYRTDALHFTEHAPLSDSP